MLPVLRRRFIDGSLPARRLGNRIEVAWARRWGWTPISRLVGVDIIVIETVGRVSGKVRSTVVSALELEDGRILISGGAVGQSREPDWVANLGAEPRARVVGPHGARGVRSEAPPAADHERWRHTAHTTWPRSARYERWSGRPLPLFLLTPDE